MTPLDLRVWRTRQRLTQAGLAACLGVHLNTVNRWECGDTTIPAFLPLALETLEARSAVPERQPVQNRASPRPEDFVDTSLEAKPGEAVFDLRETGYCSTCTAAVTTGDGHHHRNPWTIVPERQPAQARS